MGIFLEFLEISVVSWTVQLQLWTFVVDSYESCGYSQFRKSTSVSHYKEQFLRKAIAKVVSSAVYFTSSTVIAFLILELNKKEPDNRTTFGYSFIYFCSVCGCIFNATRLVILEANVMLDDCQSSHIEPQEEQPPTRQEPLTQKFDNNPQFQLKQAISTITKHYHGQNYQLFLLTTWVIAKHSIKYAFLKLLPILRSTRPKPQAHH